MQKNTAANKQTQPVVAKPRSIFALAPSELKTVVGGTGVVQNKP